MVGWRNVPVVHEVVGRFARVTEPRIRQILLEDTQGATGALPPLHPLHTLLTCSLSMCAILPTERDGYVQILSCQKTVH